METPRLYTTGELAKAINIPIGTLRTWHTRGHLTFIRVVEEEGKRSGRQTDSSVAGRWSRFSWSEALEIATMYHLTVYGVGPALALAIVERSRGIIFGDAAKLVGHSVQLFIARVDQVYRIVAGTPADYALQATWIQGGRWKGTWLSQEGEETDPPSIEPHVPRTSMVLDTDSIRQHIMNELAKLDKEDKPMDEQQVPKFLLEWVTDPGLGFRLTTPEGRVYVLPVHPATAQGFALSILAAPEVGYAMFPETQAAILQAAEEHHKRDGEFLTSLGVVKQ